MRLIRREVFILLIFLGYWMYLIHVFPGGFRCSSSCWLSKSAKIVLPLWKVFFLYERNVKINKNFTKFLWERVSGILYSHWFFFTVCVLFIVKVIKYFPYHLSLLKVSFKVHHHEIDNFKVRNIRLLVAAGGVLRC